METATPKAAAYLIECITDLHAGSGDATFGVIDNLVQRDSITEMPTINSSSIKGALREYFAHSWNVEANKENQKKLDYIFGPDTTRNENAEANIGHYKFFPADLIVLPVRSSENVPYYRATAPFLKAEIERKSEFFGLKLNFPDYPDQNNSSSCFPKINQGKSTLLEDYQAHLDKEVPQKHENLGDNLAWFTDAQMKQLAQSLPVIPRNKLENGKSKNLWYEEVVPRESRFIFFVLETKENQKDFHETIQSVNSPIQIGGNASIGRGYVTIKKISA